MFLSSSRLLRVITTFVFDIQTTVTHTLSYETTFDFAKNGSYISHPIRT